MKAKVLAVVLALVAVLVSAGLYVYSEPTMMSDEDFERRIALFS